MNFKHLYYFWVTARAGGVMRAGEQLHTTPQTLSGQIKLLEESLGRKLFRKSGRQLELTEDGRKALSYADDIFALLREVNVREQTTFLIVTHDPRLAARCDRIIELVDGSIVSDRSV